MLHEKSVLQFISRLILSVYQLEQPLVLKAFCKIKKNITTWLHYWLSFTLKKAFQFKKKKLQNRLHTQKKHPTIRESNPFYFSVAHILCYIWHLHCLFKFQVSPSWLEYYCLIENYTLLSWYWLFSLNDSLIQKQSVLSFNARFHLILTLNVLLGKIQRLSMFCFPYVLNLKTNFMCVYVYSQRYISFIVLFSLQCKLSISN